MWIELDGPNEWQGSILPGRFLITVAPDLVLEIPFLEPLPEDVWQWSRTCATRDVPAGADTAVITNKFDGESKLGWPMAVYESVAKAGDQVVESRIHTVFAMIEYGAIVVARAKTEELMAAHREQILSVLETARPYWGDDPRASLRDLLA